MRDFIKTTLIGGVFFLIPIVLLAAIVGKALTAIGAVTTPVAHSLQLQTILGIHAARMLTIIALVLLCFLAGLLSRTSVARSFKHWLETSVLSMLPGYSLIASAGEELAAGAHGTRSVVLARIEDAWQVALLVERIDDEHAAIYVPGAPNPKSGSVYIMTMDRLRPLDIPYNEATRLIKGLGVGARELLMRRGVTDL